MFTTFSKAVHAKFEELSKGELYEVDAPEIVEKYLAAYPPESNPIFRTRNYFDCNCCKHFVRRLGNVVGIKDGQMVTVWGGHNLPAPYQEVADKLDSYIKTLPIRSVFRTKERQYGTEHNYDTKTNEKYYHFVGRVDNKHYCTDPEAKKGEKDAVYQVLQRGLKEIRKTDLDSVLELIDSNNLYRGSEHREAVKGFAKLLKDYEKAKNKELFVWENLNDRNARFRNTVIGTLLTDLAEGKDLETAVKSFETKVAPANYKRPTALITQKMIEQAIEQLNELRLGGAIYRRYARLSDVSVNDVLFVDNEAKGLMKDGIASLLEGSIKKSTPKLDKAKPISADDFVKDVLPNAKSVEVFVENRHTGNFVTLTGGDGNERLFKWDNNFAWSYDGDFSDSVKQRVKAAGGNINADLRVSLSWYNFDDLDLHCKTPGNGYIYFGNKAGILDVDMNAGRGTTRNPVENLAFMRPMDGIYEIWVNQYNRRETIDIGFSIEVECNGALNQYSYGKAVQKDVKCFKLTMKGGQLTNIETDLKGGSTSQEKWGVKTETLCPVSTIMYSPNYWGDNKVGAKHLIFSLKGCRNTEPVRGIYNEFLRGDLDKHRKVFEVLGNKTKCAVSDEQISGLGFTAARNDSVTVLVDKRAYLVNF